MAVITISRGSHSMGTKVAERVAEKLAYKCVGREILLETSELFNIPETRLDHAIHDSPTILSRFTHGKVKYISHIRAALLKHLKENNTVYHGLAGQFFVKDVSHVLKVRVLADFDERVQTIMRRDKVIKKEAVRILQRDDEERNKWSRHLYGIDTTDPSLYDLVIHIHKLSVDDVVEVICHTARLDRFKATPQSEKLISDLALIAEIKAKLVDITPDAEVFANDGNITVSLKETMVQAESMAREIKTVAGTVSGVKKIDVDFTFVG